MSIIAHGPKLGSDSHTQTIIAGVKKYSILGDYAEKHPPTRRLILIEMRVQPDERFQQLHRLLTMISPGAMGRIGPL